jgi:O-antigen ligase
VLIILLAKKGPLLGLVIAMLSLALFSKRRYIKFLLIIVFLVGFLIQLSDPISMKYKAVIADKASVSVRIENYLFGLHVFKENPIFGIGFKGNVAQYLDDYKVRLDHDFSAIDYKQYVSLYYAYENIVLSFMVELGAIFSIVYFGGITYLIVLCFKQMRAPPKKNLTGIFIISVVVGFAVVSCTFDTLRYPNLNWLFHCLLGLLVNVCSKQAENKFKKP